MAKSVAKVIKRLHDVEVERLHQLVQSYDPDKENDTIVNEVILIQQRIDVLKRAVETKPYGSAYNLEKAMADGE